MPLVTFGLEYIDVVDACHSSVDAGFVIQGGVVLLVLAGAAMTGGVFIYVSIDKVGGQFCRYFN